MESVATYHLSRCATPDYHDSTHLPKSGRPLASLGHVNVGSSEALRLGLTSRIKESTFGWLFCLSSRIFLNWPWTFRSTLEPISLQDCAFPK